VSILDEIIAHKRQEVAALRRELPMEAVRGRAARTSPARDFAAAISGPPVRVIAEVKRASPSAGAIRPGADPVAMARLYEAAGAAAVSVLTDRRYFSGNADDLRAVRAAVDIPVLRKDFIVDPYQVYEARAMGADAILLIAGTVPAADLAALGRLAADLGMVAVFEVHDDAHVADVIAAGARVVGVNNRDLTTLRTDLDTTRRLRRRIPEGVLVISESGFETPDDVARVCAVGIHALLVGTALMASPDPAAHLRRLRAAAEQTGGITR
jgi:indole-3-glycerol phosphate synthase